MVFPEISRRSSLGDLVLSSRQQQHEAQPPPRAQMIRAAPQAQPCAAG
jgi:hypothetical protein